MMLLFGHLREKSASVPTRWIPVLSLAISLLLPHAARSEERPARWPSYRGPLASGVDSTAEAPASWNLKTGENVLWRTPIPGLGLSSPTIWDDDLFLTTAIAAGVQDAELKVGLYGDIASSADDGPQSWRVLCLNRKTGAIRWNVEVHEGVPKGKRHPKSSHANPTVATDGTHVVGFFGSEGLHCLDRKGNVIWSKTLGVLDSGYFRKPEAQWGFASSPVIHDGRVIVQCDVQKDSFLAAFDVRDGREIWRTPRDEIPTWGTPTVVRVDGRTQIVVNGYRHIGGYAFDTGKPIWWMKGGGDIPVPTPVFAHGLFFITNAHGGLAPIYAIRAEATGKIAAAESEAEETGAIAWWERRRGNYMQTPIVVSDNLFCCTDSGVASCFNARTGERYFRERLRTGKSGFGSTASPVSDGRKLYYPSEDGHVFVIAADKKFKRLGKNSIGGNCMATPAIVHGTLYFRTRSHMLAIGS